MKRKYPYRANRGVALIMVLVLIVMISLGAYTFTNRMIAEERSTVMSGRQLEAKAAVASGVEYLKDYLVLAAEDQAGLGGHWDNATYFKDVSVSGVEGGTRFSIVSVMQDQYGEPTGWRYGLEDQAAKININTLVSSDLYGEDSEDEGEESLSAGGENPGSGGGLAGVVSGSSGEDTYGDESEEEAVADPRQNVLMQLPAMTETIADSILDWIDEDDEMREAGAEADMYAVARGYGPTNGPISSLDELLLVDGVTPELLYGADRNHNGILEEDEVAASQTFGGAEGSMARGWSAYLTVHSMDYVSQSEDPAPVDINGDDLEALYTELLEAGIETELATYIVAYRQGGPYSPPEIPEDPPPGYQPPELPEPQSVSGMEPSFDNGGDNKFSSVLDLIGSSTEAVFADSEDDKKSLVNSPYGEDSNLSGVLPIMNSLLAVGETSGAGRVNLNHCPNAVASGLPGMDYATAQNILLSQDPMSGDVNYLYPTWPLATGAVTVEQMKALLPYVSGIGTVYRAQIIGYSDVPGVYARAEVVIDASAELPRVVSWRDLGTTLGPGFTLDTSTSAP